MKMRTFLLIGVFLLVMISVSQAQEAEEVGQEQDSSTMPTIKSLFYGFDVLDYRSEMHIGEDKWGQ